MQVKNKIYFPLTISLVSYLTNYNSLVSGGCQGAETFGCQMLYLPNALLTEPFTTRTMPATATSQNGPTSKKPPFPIGGPVLLCSELPLNFSKIKESRQVLTVLFYSLSLA